MNWQKKLRLSSVSLWIAMSALGCGVKGDPLPPDKPTEIGRGRPTYRRATEGIEIQKTQPEPAPIDADKDDENEE